jgi:hypothetical protein
MASPGLVTSHLVGFTLDGSCGRLILPRRVKAPRTPGMPSACRVAAGLADHAMAPTERMPRRPC